MNDKQFSVLIVTFWIWVQIENNKFKRRVLHKSETMVEDNHQIGDMEKEASQQLSKFRSLNNGIVHSEVYAEWKITGSVNS